MAELKRSVYQADQTGPNLTLVATYDPVIETFNPTGAGINSPPNDPATIPVSVYMSTDRNSYGVHARGVVVQFVGTPPAPYSEDTKLFIPVLLVTRFRSYKIGMLANYLGGQVMIVSKRPETTRG